MIKSKKQITMHKLIEVLKEFPQGATTSQLADRVDCVAKTIQNYYKELKFDDMSLNYINDVKMIRISHGVYIIEDYRLDLETAALEMEKKIFLKLALDNLENLTDLSRHYGEIEEELKLDRLKTPYYIKSEDYQKLNTNREAIEELEEAILKDNLVAFAFQDKSYYVEPYRLVNFDGIWYLYGKDKKENEDNCYKTWMLKHIDEVIVYLTEKYTLSDEESERHLKDAASANFIPNKRTTLKVKIFKEAANMFEAKRHLPKQMIEKQDDGSLIVTASVSVYEDVDDEIKSWLPHVEILEPASYREKFKTEMLQYMQKVWPEFIADTK